MGWHLTGAGVGRWIPSLRGVGARTTERRWCGGAASILRRGSRGLIRGSHEQHYPLTSDLFSEEAGAHQEETDGSRGQGGGAESARGLG